MAQYPQNSTYKRGFNAYLSSDHVSAATGKTFTAYIAKSGAGAYSTYTGTISELGSGAYWLDLTTSATDTQGDVFYRLTAADTDDVKFVDQVTDPVRGPGSPTALPSAAAGAAGGLQINGANSGAITYGSTQFAGLTSPEIAGLIAGATQTSAQLSGLTSAQLYGFASVQSAQLAGFTSVSASLGGITSVQLSGHTSLADIKAQTDKLTFDGSNNVASNMMSTFDKPITGGAGVSGNPFTY